MEKVVVEVGFLVEKEEEGVVAVVVGMEEEMKERMVEELVVNMVNRVASQGGHGGRFLGCCRWLEEEGRKKMKERERKRVYIYRGDGDIYKFARLFHQMRPVSHLNGTRI